MNTFVTFPLVAVMSMMFSVVSLHHASFFPLLMNRDFLKYVMLSYRKPEWAIFFPMQRNQHRYGIKSILQCSDYTVFYDLVYIRSFKSDLIKVV